MVYPQLRAIHSPTLDPPAMPDDPTDCEILFETIVGPDEGDEAETFRFLVITKAHLVRDRGARWGRGALLVDTFDWSTVAHAVAELLAASARPTWKEVVEQLSRDLVQYLGSPEEADA